MIYLAYAPSHWDSRTSVAKFDNSVFGVKNNNNKNPRYSFKIQNK